MNQKIWMLNSEVNEDKKVYKSIITPVIRFSNNGEKALCLGYSKSLISYTVFDNYFFLQESLPNVISNHVYILRNRILNDYKGYIAELYIAGLSHKHGNHLIFQNKNDNVLEDNWCSLLIQDVCEVLKL